MRYIEILIVTVCAWNKNKHKAELVKISTVAIWVFLMCPWLVLYRGAVGLKGLWLLVIKEEEYVTESYDNNSDNDNMGFVWFIFAFMLHQKIIHCVPQDIYKLIAYSNLLIKIWGQSSHMSQNQTAFKTANHHTSWWSMRFWFEPNATVVRTYFKQRLYCGLCSLYSKVMTLCV